MPSYDTRMLVLPNGHVLLSINDTTQVWNYNYATDGSAPQATWRPTVSAVSYNGDGTYTLSGTGLTGVSEGAAYGDDAEMSTNFPIVRLTNAADSSVWY